MPKDADLAAKFWKALKSDRTVMLALPGVADGHAQPMTALFEGDHSGPLWIFTSADNHIAAATGPAGREALIYFASKGHDLFATVDGALKVDTDYTTLERLWNPFVAAWFDGKDDPKLRLLRFDPRHAQIWLNENSLFASVRMLLGTDPKKAYKDKVGEVELG
ncbi:general stress protein [Caulobacter sp. Root655]|uniref:pyridoxamine 5'-phosphate oxidase family protein n=1 Tax=Caulobacter sp. Root655 TaxID=1736578 RepID=UPI0006F9CEA1|nr:pyridoxamine 5'-phosphate oxidase family protein [Caulobacter sp. Root655]KRA59364.1 general stress protein [Caulobacter sp. Root655]